MSVNSIEAIDGFQPFVPPTLPIDGSGSVTGVGSSVSTGSAFGDLLVDGLDRLEQVHDTADALAVQAATGDLDDMHDYTMVATEASVTTQLTVALRNRALEAFNEIMRMPIG